MFAHVHIGKVPGWLRAAVHGIVLGCSNRAVVLRVVALHTGDVGNAHAAGEEGIFAVGFLSAAPARVTEDVQIRGPEIQASANIAGLSDACILHIFDASLNTNLGRHDMDVRRIEGRSQTDWLRILRHALVDDSVERLAPPLVCRNIEPRNCGGSVQHLRSFFSKCHAMHQVSGPLLGCQIRVHIWKIRCVLGNCKLHN